ncbi:MAG: GIY-YIG nuclease family protein [Parcubacteria group bacterium]|jgi:putative endonuclease
MQYPLKNWKRLRRGYRFGEKTFYSSFHLGTDYIVPEGTPICAPAGCEVFVAGDFPEGGNTIHARFKNRKYGPLVLRFMHLSKMSPLGKYKAGEILGLTGNTGKLTTAPHLHIDLSRGSVKLKDFKNFLNPDKFFSENLKKIYCLYVLECADKTLYTGITTDLKRRIAEHGGTKLGAKYTCARRPVKLVYSKKFKNRSAASKEEARIKKLKKTEKLELIKE